MNKPCKDCTALGLRNTRPTPHPGPRCTTHHRQWKRERKTQAHNRHLQTTYGITTHQYNQILQHQNGTCYICQRASGKTKQLSVDHNHQTGEVRGLLCGPCNRHVLGHLRDNTEALNRAIEYLNNPPARKALEQ